MKQILNQFLLFAASFAMLMSLSTVDSAYSQFLLLDNILEYRIIALFPDNILLYQGLIQLHGYNLIMLLHDALIKDIREHAHNNGAFD